MALRFPPVLLAAMVLAVAPSMGQSACARPDEMYGARGYPRGNARDYPRGDAQGAARRGVNEGAIHHIRDIERRVVPTMPGMQYLGFEYDPAMMAYRLRFIRQGRVTFVDVDARSGEVIGLAR